MASSDATLKENLGRPPLEALASAAARDRGSGDRWTTLKSIPGVLSPAVVQRVDCVALPYKFVQFVVH